MKRFLSVLLVFFVVFGFVACGNDNPSPSGSTSVPDETVTEHVSKVMSDADALIELQHMTDRPAEYEELVSKFDMPQDQDTIRLKEGETVTGPHSGYVYSSVMIRTNDDAYEVDADYTDHQNKHSIYIKMSMSGGTYQASVVFDGTSYSYKESMSK